MRKPAFRICKNKDADQLHGNRAVFFHAADQHLCFCYMASTIPLLPKSEIHLLWLYSLACVGPGWKPRRPVFLRQGSLFCSTYILLPVDWFCRLSDSSTDVKLPIFLFND